MKITLGFSPCPNDTFIFDALVNQKIDTGGLIFEPMLEDVQTLNRRALQGKPDVTKLSYAVLPLVTDNYVLLTSGSALGSGVGPLLISKENETAPAGERNANIELMPVAIPGENTTAHLLFSLAYPAAKNKIFLRYDEIENFVLEGKGLGVIIHENRFTYADKGLHKVIDLGDYWEKQTRSPIPLGGIVAKRSMDPALLHRIDGLIRKSIEFSFAAYPQLNDYIRDNAREMSEDVMRKHIDLYVNTYSLDLGQKGKDAVRKLFEVYNQLNGLQVNDDNLFLN